MGFWDNYETTNGLNFLTKEEKEVLINEAIPFTVSRVFRAQSKFGPRFIVITELDGEERAIGFAEGTVDSRDNTFAAMMGYLEREDAESPSVIMRRVGRAVVVDPGP